MVLPAAAETAAPAAAAGAKKRRRRTTVAPLHDRTKEASTGAGAAAARAVGRRARASDALWDLSVPPPPCVAPQTTLRAVPRSAAAAAQLELARARALDKLRAKLHDLCAAHGLEAPPQLAFERWRFGCKLREEEEAAAAAAAAAAGAGSAKASAAKRKRPLAGLVDTDALLPCAADGGDGGGLASDLERAGLSPADAAAAARALHDASRAEQRTVAASAQRLNSGATCAPSGVPFPELQVAFHRRSVDFSLGTAGYVTLTREAYGKLAALHRAHGPQEERTPAPAAAAAAAADGDADGEGEVDAAADAEAAEAEAAADDADAAAVAARRALHLRCFTLLLRYKALRGHGFQAAAGPPVFEVLRSHLRVAFECFASPLNARYGRFCSAFDDTDACFGSAGSFFSFAADSGSYEVNPPFAAEILDAAADRVLRLLAGAEAANAPLCFAVLFPGWAELRGRAALLASPLLRFSLRVAADDHGFCDGASHARRDPFRASPYDTDVLVLQTRAAAKATPVCAAELEAELRAAFAACVPSLAAAKRQRRAPPK
jgi:phosphorylated CTD-interacting factor 1